MILYMKALYFTYSKIRGDLMLLHTFLFVDVYKRQTLINMRFLAINPPFSLQIHKDAQQIFHISLNEGDYRLFKGRNHLYVLMNHILYRCDKDFTKACEPMLSGCLDVYKRQL